MNSLYSSVSEHPVRNILILLNQSAQGHTKLRIVGLDIITGTVVNITDTDGCDVLGSRIYYTFHSISKHLNMAVGYVIKAMVKYCPAHASQYMNTFIIDEEPEVIGYPCDICKLYAKYISCCRDMPCTLAIGGIAQFLADHPGTRGYVLLSVPIAERQGYRLLSSGLEFRLQLPDFPLGNSSPYFSGLALAEFVTNHQGNSDIRIINLFGTLSKTSHATDYFSTFFPPHGSHFIVSDQYDDQFALNYSITSDTAAPAPTVFPTFSPSRYCTDAAEYLRNIRHATELVHFTSICNLPSILEQGILPRNQRPHGTIVSDERRLDRHTDCNCFSISFPNYRMFYKKRNEHRELYIVLGVNVDLLNTLEPKNVAFYPGNAASSGLYIKNGQVTGINALEALFDEIVLYKGVSYRRSDNIPSSYATNPQSEVLIRGIVPPRFIETIYVQNAYDKLTVEQALPRSGSTPNIVICPKMFRRREDYSLWLNSTNGGINEWQPDLYF